MATDNQTNAPPPYDATDDDPFPAKPGDHMGWGGVHPKLHNDDVELRLRAFDQQLGIYHAAVADLLVQSGLYGSPGERRVGVNAQFTGIEENLDVGKLIGDDVILEAKVRVGRAICNVSAGEDGFNFNVGTPLIRATLNGGASDPDSNHDSQGTIGLSVLDPVPVPSFQGHWGDIDNDGYREFGFGFVAPIIPGLALVLDFKLEIGVSDKDFIKFGDDVKDIAEDFAEESQEAFAQVAPAMDKGWNNFEDDTKRFFNHTGHDLQYAMSEDGMKDFGTRTEQGLNDFGDALVKAGNDVKNFFESWRV